MVLLGYCSMSVFKIPVFIIGPNVIISYHMLLQRWPVY